MKTYLELSETRLLENQADNLRDRLLIRILFCLGCRVSEALGMTEEEWYRLLNSKVFFWPDWQALKWFLQATAYFNKPHVVITIDTHRLLGKYADMITLSPINTGSTFPRRNQISPEPRGKDTFKRIQEYQLPRARELAVDDGVEDLVRFTVSVQRLIIKEKDAEPEVLEILWQPNHQ